MLVSNKSEDKATGIYCGLIVSLLTDTRAWVQFLMVVSDTAVVPQCQVNSHTSSVCKTSFPSSHKHLKLSELFNTRLFAVKQLCSSKLHCLEVS